MQATMHSSPYYVSSTCCNPVITSNASLSASDEHVLFSASERPIGVFPQPNHSTKLQRTTYHMFCGVSPKTHSFFCAQEKEDCCLNINKQTFPKDAKHFLRAVFGAIVTSLPSDLGGERHKL